MSKHQEITEGIGLWAKRSTNAIREDGLSGIKESSRLLYTNALRFYGLLNNYGDPIYESDWDILVVLDACRADLMEEVSPEYDFINFGTADSLGSCSPEWMEKNFTEEYAAEMDNTAYITGNPYSDTRLNPNDFQVFDEVWKYGWDDELGTIPPDILTDRAIMVAREEQPDRLIVHYMQPHHPFVPSPLGDGMDQRTGEKTSFGALNNVWTRLQRGELTRDEVWEGYRGNLEYVLESVELLLNNINGDTIITADHGNALGEYHMYGHPIYAPVWPLKQVPWCEYSATDSQEYTPETSSTESNSDSARDSTQAREDKLAALGYL